VYGTIMRPTRKDSSRHPVAEASKLRAATPDVAANANRIGHDPTRGSLGNLASVPERASVHPTPSRLQGPAKENRPPEAWRATTGAGASAERLARKKFVARAVGRSFGPLGRASVRLGADTTEARTSRLLRGAGLSVDAWEVKERSGFGPEVARGLLDLALVSVREAREQRPRVTLSVLPPRTSDDPLS
jgi:hypothetical protein